MANLTRALSMPDGTEYEFIGKPYYGVCDATIYASNSYRVDIDGFTAASLVPGVRVSVLFNINPNTLTTRPSSLNVSGTGAKYMRLYDGTFSYSSAGLTIPSSVFSKGEVVDFVYDGTCWLLMPSAQIVWSGICSTAANIADKTVNIYGLSDEAIAKHGTMLVVYFENGNTASNPTLSVNNTPAEYISTSGSTASGSIFNCVFGANTHLLMRYYPATGYVPRWIDLTYRSISDSTVSDSSTTAASSKAVRSAYLLASSKYSKPSTGIPASDLASGVIPSAVSELTNDAGYLTLADLPIYDGSVS